MNHANSNARTFRPTRARALVRGLQALIDRHGSGARIIDIVEARHA